VRALDPLHESAHELPDDGAWTVVRDRRTHDRVHLKQGQIQLDAAWAPLRPGMRMASASPAFIAAGSVNRFGGRLARSIERALS